MVGGRTLVKHLGYLSLVGVIVVTGMANAASCPKDELHEDIEALSKNVDWMTIYGYEPDSYYIKGVHSTLNKLPSYEPYNEYDIQQSTDRDYLSGVGSRKAYLESVSLCGRGHGHCDLLEEDVKALLRQVKQPKISLTFLQSISHKYGQACKRELKSYTLNKKFPLNKKDKFERKNKFFPDVRSRFRQVFGDQSYGAVIKALYRTSSQLTLKASSSVGRWYSSVTSMDILLERAAENRLAALDANERESAQSVDDAEKSADVAEKKRVLRGKLIRGEEAITSFGHAIIRYDAERFPIEEVVMSPRLKADQDFYAGFFTVDTLEGDGTVRVTHETFEQTNMVASNLYGSTSVIGQKYAFLKMNSKDISTLSVNAYIGVVVKYVDNQEYLLTTGETKIAPVFDVLYVERQR